ncbi:hypothetical protein CC79DRAFT_1334385 [Sarocladium strictum]
MARRARQGCPGTKRRPPAVFSLSGCLIAPMTPATGRSRARLEPGPVSIYASDGEPVQAWIPGGPVLS